MPRTRGLMLRNDFCSLVKMAVGLATTVGVFCWGRDMMQNLVEGLFDEGSGLRMMMAVKEIDGAIYTKRNGGECRCLNETKAMSRGEKGSDVESERALVV